MRYVSSLEQLKTLQLSISCRLIDVLILMFKEPRLYIASTVPPAENNTWMTRYW